MGTVVDLVATLVAVLGLLASLGHLGYLGLVSSVAGRRPGAADYARAERRRLPAAGGLALGALVALLLTGADAVAVDVLALLLGGGIGVVSATRLAAARRRLASPPRDVT